MHEQAGAGVFAEGDAVFYRNNGIDKVLRVLRLE
jgi:hypothetical protein